MADELGDPALRADQSVKQAIASARVLVATDNANDANQILRQLRNDIAHVRASTDSEKAVEDFEDYRPDVLVLAFDCLDKAQSYYLGLYRLGKALHQHPHRTVILCNKDEVRAVFELCKKEFFDDYVLYWPHTHDGPRLAMSIWMACREMVAMRAETPGPAELLAHARHLGELEQTLDRGLAAGASSAEPANAWARKLRDQIQPSLAGTRAFADKARQLRPIVMVVEDDEFARQLVAGTLDVQKYDVLFVGDGRAALSQLRRVRPDVILMDIRLPGMDGVEVTARLKATPQLSEIPVVMMTGDARRETLVNSVEAGASAFVVKPFTRESLVAKLEKVLFG